MNLIEELAKQEMIKNHYIEHWTAGEKTGYWDGIADKELFRSKVKDFIPIFAEWIKGVEKPLAATLDDFPYTIMPLTIKDAFAIGVKSFESNILSALDKKE